MIKQPAKSLMLAILMLTLCITAAWAQKVQPYLETDDLPDILSFLPPPPAEGSHLFDADIAIHNWARELKPSERTRRAIFEGTTNVDTMALAFSGAFGKKLSKETTPQTMYLLERCIRTFRLAAAKPKREYMRKRPFVYFNEGTLIPEYEEEERNTGSYPSGHTSRGWGMALVLAQLNPERQDTLMSCGYEWGQSRVIANYHWQSDVDAARLMTSATFARLQACEEYRKDLAAALDELSADKPVRMGDEQLLREPRSFSTTSVTASIM